MTQVFEQNQQAIPASPWNSSNQPPIDNSSANPPNVPSQLIEPAQVKESIFKKIIPLVGVLILILIIYLIVSKIILPITKKSKQGALPAGKKISLTYWGLWEPENVINPLIADYQKTHPEVIITYSLQSHKDYRERLQSALARGEGPDIFRFHHTWIPMLKKDLAVAPNDIAQVINLSSNYYPVAGEYLKVAGQTLAVPLEFDSLALFYNQKIFKAGGKIPPTTWEELRKTALDLTVKDASGNIQVAGVALGTTNNVDHFSDILGLMMLQNSADLTKPTGSLAEDALKFYTLFVTTDRVWDKSLPASTYAFATEKVAMYFGPSWRVHDIKQLNPNLDFKIVPVPQLPETKVAWATFWAEGVAGKSKNTKAAWEFLAYLSSKEGLSKFYTNASQVRSFGEPYPRIDMASEIENDPFVGSFTKQGSYAKSGSLCSNTFDNGINDRMIKYYEDAVNAVLQNQPIATALATAAQGVAQVLSQYGTK